MHLSLLSFLNILSEMIVTFVQLRTYSGFYNWLLYLVTTFIFLINHKQNVILSQVNQKKLFPNITTGFCREYCYSDFISEVGCALPDYNS